MIMKEAKIKEGRDDVEDEQILERELPGSFA